MKFAEAKRGYGVMWDAAAIRSEKAAAVHTVARAIIANRSRYEPVSASTKVPWWWIGITHNLESGMNFGTHLHNGDPLSARTVQVPAGRPPYGNPPYTWQVSAVDALELKGLQKVERWTVERALYEFERYNGFGYVPRKVNSPYVWSMTNHYTAGKYVRDGVFDPAAVSKQVGAAAVLLALVEIGEVVLERETVPTPAPSLADDLNARLELERRKQTEIDPMRELTDALAGFVRIAPNLAAAAGGPLAVLATRALAEALDVPEASPTEVKAKLEAAPVSKLLSALKTADEVIKDLVPSEPIVVSTPEATVTVPTPAPATPQDVSSPLDRLFGDKLKGWKTFIAAAVIVALQIADALAPGLIPIPIGEAVTWLAGLLGGAGVVAKVERWLMFLRPQPAAVVVTK